MNSHEYQNRFQTVLNTINQGNLAEAKAYVDELVALTQATLQEYQKVHNEEFANEWLLRRLSISFIKHYIRYFDCILNNDYRESWDLLQECKMRLLPLTKYRDIYQCLELEYLESRLGKFEKLYPFSMYLSIGAKFKKITCSICGYDVRDGDCTHIMGMLYNGQIATRLLDDGDILEVSVVEKPYDRRCVLEPKGGFGDTWKKIFNEFSKFRDLITLEFEVVEYRKDEVGKLLIDPEMKCYCKSGDTFMNCCWAKVENGKRYIHVELVGYRDLKANYNTAVELEP